MSKIARYFLYVHILLIADPAWATQAHGPPEGIYAHQFAHVFFMLSMGIFIYWLRQRRLIRESGWRFIQYSALFFILWNLDTFVVHLLDEQLGIIESKTIGLWKISLEAQNGYRGIEPIYYIAKLDHLICVPALLLLFTGLRRLYHASFKTAKAGDSP